MTGARPESDQGDLMLQLKPTARKKSTPFMAYNCWMTWSLPSSPASVHILYHFSLRVQATLASLLSSHISQAIFCLRALALAVFSVCDVLPTTFQKAKAAFVLDLSLTVIFESPEGPSLATRSKITSLCQPSYSQFRHLVAEFPLVYLVFLK